jgi:hypothetical protein
VTEPDPMWPGTAILANRAQLMFGGRGRAFQLFVWPHSQGRLSARKVMAAKPATESNGGKYGDEPSVCRPASLYAGPKLGEVVVRFHIQPPFSAMERTLCASFLEHAFAPKLASPGASLPASNKRSGASRL